MRAASSVLLPRLRGGSGAPPARVRTLLVAVCLQWLLIAVASVAVAQVAVPQLTGRVVDQTGTLTSGEIEGLTQKLKAFEDRKGSQIAVLIVPTTQPESIEQFSLRVAEAWKIGRKKIDDGAILVVAKNDRHLRIEVGYGLEGALTDVVSRRIIDEEIAPKFRGGDFAGGIVTGVDKIVRVVDGETLPAPSRNVKFDHSDDLYGFNPDDVVPVLAVIAFATIGLGGFFRAVFGRLIGSLVSGGIVAAIAWFMVGSFVLSAIAGVLGFLIGLFADLLPATRSGPGSSSGGWSGGSSSGGWSGGSSSSSDSGGFSGGGGSFGGGGASGSW